MVPPLNFLLFQGRQLTTDTVAYEGTEKLLARLHLSSSLKT